MDPALKAVIKDMLHLLVDKELEALIKAELAKLPAQYQPIVLALEPAIVPNLIKVLDDKIEKM